MINPYPDVVEAVGLGVVQVILASLIARRSLLGTWLAWH